MWALLPLKNFANAKQRLSGVLSPEERHGLFQAMVKDVMKLLQLHPDIDNTLLVSDDPLARQLAHDYGAEFLSESTLRVSGLNDAIQAAVDTLSQRGINEVMVVHGDLPLMRAREIRCLVRAHRKQGAPALTIAPDHRREGSNCVLCTPASRLVYAYGNGSLAKHAAQASELGMSLKIVDMPGIGCDIDTPQDLMRLIEQADLHNAPHTYQYLSETGLIERLKPGEKNQFAEADMPYSRAS